MSERSLAEDQDERRAAASRFRLRDAGFGEGAAGWLRALESDDLATRIEAAFLLGRANNITAKPALIRALEGEQARVRVEAALALARLGEPTIAFPVLESELDGQFFIDAPLRAARALAMLGNPSGYRRVIEALHSPLPANRMEAIAVLPAFAKFDGSDVDDVTIDVVAALVTAASDGEPLLRRDALTTLAEFADPRAQAAIDAALNDSDPGVRDLAASLSPPA